MIPVEPEELERLANGAIAAIQYRSDSAHLVLISGKVLDLTEAQKFTKYLNSAGAYNVATVYIDKSLSFDEAVRVYKLPVPYAVTLWYALKDIWKRIMKK